MTKRKFTPPTKFPAEYVDGHGGKAVVLGISPNCAYPLIGYNSNGDARSWTELGAYYDGGMRSFDLHDIPKRITTWHNVYPDNIVSEYVTRESADFFAVNQRLCVYRIERDEDGGNPEIFVEDV